MIFYYNNRKIAKTPHISSLPFSYHSWPGGCCSQLATSPHDLLTRGWVWLPVEQVSSRKTGIPRPSGVPQDHWLLSSFDQGKDRSYRHTAAGHSLNAFLYEQPGQMFSQYFGVVLTATLMLWCPAFIPACYPPWAVDSSPYEVDSPPPWAVDSPPPWAWAVLLGHFSHSLTSIPGQVFFLCIANSELIIDPAQEQP